MLCNLALYSQCWEVVVYQEIICILALRQKYETCNYVRERQNLLRRKTKAIKISGYVSIKPCVAEHFALNFIENRQLLMTQVKNLPSESSVMYCQSAEIMNGKHFSIPPKTFLV